MEAITLLFKQDFPALIFGCFIILSAFIAAYEIIGKFSKIIGRPVAWVRTKESDHELLFVTVNGLKELQQKHDDSVAQSIRHDKFIRDDLEKLTRLFVDKEIDDWRWEILNMASAISSGRNYSKEQFDHVLRTYEKYEQLLNDNHMSNGQVDASMDVIREVYKEKLKNGF